MAEEARNVGGNGKQIGLGGKQIDIVIVIGIIARLCT